LTDHPELDTTAGKIADLKKRYQEAMNGAGEEAIAKQRAKGKQTARERVHQLLDPGSFVEIDEFVRDRSSEGKSRPYGDSVSPDWEPFTESSRYIQPGLTIFGGSWASCSNKS
jgi:Acetyl-CoA carboxylase, carboxyltransferase component (subunits alpha and beta)